MGLLCACETYFLNETLFGGDYFFAFFWGIILFRDIYHIYKVDKFTQTLLSTTKKKD